MKTESNDTELSTPAPAPTNTQTKPSEALAARISDERAKLAVEEANEIRLTGERKRLLTDGTREQLHACELELDTARSEQMHSQERIELLTDRHNEALERERNADLDALMNQTVRAREAGERLIRNEYAKQARALAATLAKLQAIDAGIRRANVVLEAAGRSAVSDSNTIRCTMPLELMWTETKLIDASHVRHPEHGKHRMGGGGRAMQDGSTMPRWYERADTGKPIADVEAQIEHRKYLQGEWPAPLYDVIVLPAAEPQAHEHARLPKAAQPQPFWTANDSQGFPRQVDDTVIDQVLAEVSR